MPITACRMQMQTKEQVSTWAQVWKATASARATAREMVPTLLDKTTLLCMLWSKKRACKAGEAAGQQCCDVSRLQNLRWADLGFQHVPAAWGPPHQCPAEQHGLRPPPDIVGKPAGPGDTKGSETHTTLMCPMM